MEIHSFVKFHAAAGNESAIVQALRTVLAASRGEPGCLSIHAFRGTRDQRVFCIHSRWESEEAFEKHAKLPHTVRFLLQMDKLIDQPREVTRTQLID